MGMKRFMPVFVLILAVAAHGGVNTIIRNPDVPPRLLKSSPAKYTPEARKAGIQGYVLLEVVVEREGHISGGVILKPLPLGLSHMAMEAVKDWKFAPAKHRNRKVRAYHRVSVQFSLP